MDPIFTIVVSLVAAILGSVISPLIIYHLNERQPKLELYKIVYPEQFKAVQSFMTNAYELQIEVFKAININQQGNWFHSPTMEHIKEFRRQADAMQWLLGPKVSLAACEIFSVIMKAQTYPLQADFEMALREAYRGLDVAVTNEMHISKLKTLFSD